MNLEFLKDLMQTPEGHALKKFFVSEAAKLSTRTDLSHAKVKFEKFIFKLLPTAANACLTV